MTDQIRQTLNSCDRSLAGLLSLTTKTVFTTQDLAKLWRYKNYMSLIMRLEYLKKTGQLIKIRKGLYQIKGRAVNELELANKLRTPSYISFETVLFREGAILQWDRRITLAGAESISFKIQGQKIIFRQLQEKILLNNLGIVQEGNYFIAILERAVLDMIYLAPKFYFDSLDRVDFNLLHKLASLYEKKSIINLVKKMEKRYA
ncbi:hypothetical protein KKE34_00785 [Patescibacteria group bacterium]|nr:hypothetical protein [Patescibacteria group bacterium]MBU1885125.1 hypothetical protein [Patescibacteria group bacterium]